MKIIYKDCKPNLNNVEDIVFKTSLTCTKAEIYKDNAKQYARWWGNCVAEGKDNNQYNCKVFIPKMGLDFTQIDNITETMNHPYFGYIRNKHEIFVSNEDCYDDELVITISPIEKEMTIGEIEKELGYKIKIKGEK